MSHTKGFPKMSVVLSFIVGDVDVRRDVVNMADLFAALGTIVVIVFAALDTEDADVVVAVATTVVPVLINADVLVNWSKLVVEVPTTTVLPGVPSREGVAVYLE